MEVLNEISTFGEVKVIPVDMASRHLNSVDEIKQQILGLSLLNQSSTNKITHEY